MSTARQQLVFRRPSMATKVAAVCVLITLAAVAAFSVFAAPTRVPVTGGTKLTPTTVTPSGSGEPPDSGDRPAGSNGG